MKNLLGYRHKATLLIVIALLAVGCSRDEGGDDLTYDPGKDPVRIGVCMKTDGESDGYSKKIINGIRMANDIMGVIDNARVTLVIKDSCNVEDSSDLQEVMAHDGLHGLISSLGETKQGIAALDARADQGCITVQVARRTASAGTDVQIFSLGSTMVDQARAAALFAVRSLEAASVAVVLDQKNSSSVLLASLFSSELISAGGRIENIAYVGDGPEELGLSVISMMRHDPDVIYIPYSEGTSHMVISEAKKKGFSADMIISNVIFEQEFLDKGGRDLDGVYLITDFHPGCVQSKRGEALMEKYARKSKELGVFETCSALGSDAYFLLCDLLSLPEGQDNVEAAVDMVSSMETLSGITGIDETGRITKNMHVCRIHSGIIRGIRTVYKESINPYPIRSCR